MQTGSSFSRRCRPTAASDGLAVYLTCLPSQVNLRVQHLQHLQMHLQMHRQFVN
jgi:hypothetical protein